MRLTERIYLIGSGTVGGFNISHPLDCNVYLLDGGEEMALVDAGAGVDIGPMLQNVRRVGLDPGKIRTLLLTHKHADHSGGASAWRRALGLHVMIAHDAVRVLETGDEEAISLDVGKRSGTYPPDYRFHACPVSRALRDGDVVKVGDLEVKVIETPGHCDGHLSFLVDEGGRSSLFAGDALLHGGRIVLQNIPDCTIEGHRKSIYKLAALSFDGFFAGHATFSVHEGKRHVDAAVRAFEAGGIPPLFA